MNEYIKMEEGNLSGSENVELLSRDFFSRGIEVDISRIFPMMVMATMSSGKSTIINALLGEDILPRRNAACTAKVYSVLDDDRIVIPTLYITSDDGYVNVVRSHFETALEDANRLKSVKDILIMGQIKGVLNTDKALLIVDTPGPNNSKDVTHEKITREVLSKLKGGLLLYVVNAGQMGIRDDARLLNILREYLESHHDTNVLFVINKMDEVDIEKESISELVGMTQKYLLSNGMKNPEIIPVSALAAVLFKKVLAGKNLTRNEYRKFQECYDLFHTSDIRMESYAITRDIPDRQKIISLNGKEYTVGGLLAALENTGITYLEKYIQNVQILSSSNSMIKVEINER